MTLGDLEGLDNALIAQRLILSRQVVGAAQNDFAKRAGIKNSTYNQYETGTNRPAIEVAAQLKSTYHLTLDWIYVGDPSGLPMRMVDAMKALLATRTP